MAAAARLKAEAENAAREKERQTAEAARIAKEKEAALQKQLAEQKIQEQQRQAALAEAARQQAEAAARAKKEAAAHSPVVTAPAVSTPVAAATAKTVAPAANVPIVVRNEITNGIGMILIPMPVKWSATKVWVGKYEVTQAEYERVMGTNPSRSTHERQPVENVSWNEAIEFCRKLNDMEQSRLPAGKIYGLPTAKQWEEFSGGQKFEDLTGSASVLKNGPVPVGQSGAVNKFGLFDVLGNVWEWCSDGTAENTKLLKGGAFNSAKYDRYLKPDAKEPSCGFRCVLAAQ